MPKANDWTNFIYVNLGFIAQVAIMYYFTAVSQIKQNWSQYRCNPLYMPLSDNIEQDFVYCIQTMQTGFMGYLLQPLQYITSNLSSMGGNFTSTINDVRNMMSNIRTFITSIVQSIFGVFLNLIIEFQKIIISIKDLIGKLVGVMATMMYILDGSVKTMQSGWNGPNGQMVRALGHCFYPMTKLKLKNGKVIPIKHVKLNDVLENDSRVKAVMHIDNIFQREKLYKIPYGKDMPSEFIYVSGSHFVFFQDKFIQVKDYPFAVLQDNIKTDELYCLITSDHKIKIGNHLFYDYEDHLL